MLYLTGYGLTLDDLRGFRQWGSRTPGHPEHNHTPGVEVTTGPLGQGVANGVGMGIAERWLRTHFSRRGLRPPHLRHRRRRLLRGGDLPRSGLAGRPSPARAGWSTSTTTTTSPSTDPPSSPTPTTSVERFAAYGWSVDNIGEVANDLDAIEAALLRAKAEEDRPSLIILRSHIGYPSPHLTDTAKAHGDPFSERGDPPDQGDARPPPDETFWVPDEVLELYRPCIPTGRALRADWNQRFEAWNGDKQRWEAAQRRPRHARLGVDTCRRSRPRTVPWPPARRSRPASTPPATVIPGLMPGAADLTGNTGMAMAGAIAQSLDEPGGDLIHYGIREHGMGGGHDRDGRPPRASFRWAAPSSSSATTCGARSGSPPSPTSTSSTPGPTTRSAWARTAPPTSPSSSWPPCGPCPNCG